MKRTRRIAFLLVTVLVMSLMSISAFAKGGKVNVPTAGEYYEWNKYTNQWVKEGTFTAAYKKDGSIINYKYTEYQDPASVHITPANTREIKYTWKKGLITKETYINTYYYGGDTKPVYPETYTSTTKYKYKGTLPKKVTYTYQHVDTDPEYSYQNNTTTSVTSYSWKGKIGTRKTLNKANGDKSSSLVEATKKGQYKGSYYGNSTTEYMKNGSIKKVTTKSKGSQYSGTSITKYNKYGYMSSYSSVKTYSEPSKVGTDSETVSVSYVMGSGKCPAEIVYTKTVNNGSHNPRSTTWTPSAATTTQYRVVVTATKSVKKAMNCDKYGNGVWLLDLNDGFFNNYSDDDD
jgi:hypothetical protein